ncbi:MAG TPA: 50S ribosomal protein L15 [Candidatus Saccharibacteria bacterium]|nr:50S ribosomal protein L15 [Candidatus Saccharibacteria bacterium]
MKFNELKTVKSRQTKRVGRGIAAGQGKTAGRGTKGQKARTGYSARPGFEGGQNPLSQRFPKLRGFRSHRVAAEVVFTDQISSLGATVDNHSLVKAGLLENPHTRVKLLTRGEYAAKQTVKLQLASKSAVATLEKAGGSFVATGQVPRVATKKTKKTD